MEENNENEVKVKNKKKKVKLDKMTIAKRVMASLLAALMVLSIAGTLIYYLTQSNN